MNQITLMVCPHDTARGPEGWYRLAQYVTKKLEISVRFELSIDFEDFHAGLSAATMVYGNPTDSFRLIQEQGYIPLVRPAGLYDEVVFVAKTDVANPTIESLQGESIATVKKLLPTKIALRMLERHSVIPGDLLDCASWLSVIRSVFQGDVRYGIVYKDTYDELSDQGKSMVNMFATSDEKVAFHCINIAPSLATHQHEIETIFLHMDADPDGREVLGELQYISKWVAVTTADCDNMKELVARYA